MRDFIKKLKELDREMSILRKLSARLHWFTEIYLKEVALNISSNKKVMFLSWSPSIEIRTNVLARNACGYDVIRETAKSQSKYPQYRRTAISTSCKQSPAFLPSFQPVCSSFIFPFFCLLFFLFFVLQTT